jgi:hypothetical protein
MRGSIWGLTLVLCVACGGRAASFEGGAGATHVGAAVAQNAGASGEDGASGAPEPSTPNYVPDQAVPFDHAYLADGSFENDNGFGWDACYSHTPGSLSWKHNSSSEGMIAIEFTPGSCNNCADAPSDSQLYLWFSTQPETAMSLYFDAANLNNAAPLGELRLQTTSGVCQTLRPLVSIPLADLALGPTWQARCIDLPAFNSDPALGVAVTGTTFDIGLDAFRLGPPCHALR